MNRGTARTLLAPDASEDIVSGSIRRMREALIAREISPVELVSEALARVRRDEPKLRAWVEVDAESALAAAREVDVESGPLAGIPFGAKDVIDVRGFATRYGTRWMSGDPPARFDAWCVAAMRAAGAIPLGKLETTPFAFSDPAPTRNPWNTLRTPGGSSAGSGAAVGARQIPFAFATQTGGSTLRPAAYCGAVGFKPTFGAIPTAGVSRLAPTFDHVGIICRDADDATTLFGLFDPSVANVPAPAVPRLLMAVGFHEEIAGIEIRMILETAAARLSRAGATIIRGPLPADLDAAHTCWRTICAYEARANLAESLRDQPLSPLLRALLDEACDAASYREAQLQRLRLRPKIDALFERYDAIVLPAAGPVPDVTTTGTEHQAFLRPWSFFGMPSISLPVEFDADGMPVGLQIVAKRGDDACLLAIARWAESAIEFANPGPRRLLDRA
ncbi:MAG TPA: amidase [Candidatus Acidoferrum sp.]|nr:amidase [Candidatus Acidoferrum sp.]